MDPLFTTYPYYTPYQFASNNPIVAIDVDGLESSNDKNPTQITQQEITSTQSKLEYLKSKAEIVKAQIELDKEFINIYKNEYLKALGFDGLTFWLPSRWVADAVYEGILGNQSNTDFLASCLAKTTLKLKEHVSELQTISSQYEAIAGEFAVKINNAETIKTNNGLVFNKLSSGLAIGALAHKNSKNARGTWVFYEIIVEGQTLRFGIADADNLRKRGKFAGVPERLAQQLSKISRNAPELVLEYKVTPILAKIKAEALLFESKAIFNYARAAGVPMGNLAEAAKWAEAYGLSGLSAEVIKALRPFLKLVK